MPLPARQPLVVVADSHLATPPAARVLAHPGGVLLATATHDAARAAPLQALGAEVLVLPQAAAAAASAQVNLTALVAALGERGINELHVEAGATLTGALASAGLIDEWLLYLAPVWLGDGPGVATLAPLSRLADALRWRIVQGMAVGDDWRLQLRRAGPAPN